jgi:hypothetical protein
VSLVLFCNFLGSTNRFHYTYTSPHQSHPPTPFLARRHLSYPSAPYSLPFYTSLAQVDSRRKHPTNPLPTVPMNQYPQSPDLAHQPPVYQSPEQHAQQYQQAQMYQQPQQGYGAPTSPPPQAGYASPQPTGQMPYQQQPQMQAQPQFQGQGQQPGMPPQQQSGPVYHHATPVANLGRGPAPADCPACGQRAMTTVAYEVGNATQ